MREHYIERADVSAWALYLFLASVADASGLSYYAEASLCRRLHLDPRQLARARGGHCVCAVEIGPLAVAWGQFQVVSFAPDWGWRGQHVVITSLLDTTTYPAEGFADLYHSRWRIEEAFKRLKHRMALENTAGLSWLAAQQDFGAKVLADNLLAVAVLEATATCPTNTSSTELMLSRI